MCFMQPEMTIPSSNKQTIVRLAFMTTTMTLLHACMLAFTQSQTNTLSNIFNISQTANIEIPEKLAFWLAQQHFIFHFVCIICKMEIKSCNVNYSMKFCNMQIIQSIQMQMTKIAISTTKFIENQENSSKYKFESNNIQKSFKLSLVHFI